MRPRRRPGRLRLLRPFVLAIAVLGVACAVGAGSEDGTEGAAGIDRDTAARVAAPSSDPERLVARVRAVHPHDREAYTQGLLWHDGALYESVGHYGRSALRRVALASGEIEKEVRLPADLFAEGLTRSGETLLQLTWRAGRGLRYDLASFELREGFSYTGQGWGLCLAGSELVRSDGTSRLSFHREDDFALIRTLDVERGGAPQTALNELECVEGWIYANVYQTDEIVRIDAATGQVAAVIDASGLLTVGERETAEVLNGIAYYPPNRSFLLTGKYWPKLFEVVFVEDRNALSG